MPTSTTYIEPIDNGLSITFNTVLNGEIVKTITAPKFCLSLQLTSNHVIITIKNTHESISWDATMAHNFNENSLQSLYALISEYLSSDIGLPPMSQKILDIYSNAVAAYSLRKLKMFYGAAIIKVRRSSDNQELDIFASGDGLDIDALLSFTGSSSAYVTKWYDQSGNGRHTEQSILSMQPRIVNSGSIETVNGNPAVYFYSEPSWEIYSPIAQTWAQYNAAFVAKADNDISVFSTVVSTWNDFHGELGIIRVQDSGTDAYYRAASTVQNIGDMTYPDGNLYFNGTLVNSSNKVVNHHIGFVNIGSGDFERYANRVIIGNHAATDRTWDGYIQELIIWGTDYSGSRTAIESNLSNYYNITLSA